MGGSLILFQPPVVGSSGFVKLQNKITSRFGVLKISKEPAKFPQRTHPEPTNRWFKVGSLIILKTKF
jgi:hypothetical protein